MPLYFKFEIQPKRNGEVVSLEVDFNAFMLNPFVLMFAAVFTGLMLGKISIGRFKLGVSGTLFSGLFIGKYAYGCAIALEGSDCAAAGKIVAAGLASKDFFQLFLILFVAAVGLLASRDMGAVLKKYGLKFIALGIIITFTGALTAYGAFVFGNIENTYEMTGLYTGALTSSPGFAAAVETAGDKAMREAEEYDYMSDDEKALLLLQLDPAGNLTPENTPGLSEGQKARLVDIAESGVGVGNAIAYPFGVLIVILSMNAIPVILKMDMEEEKRIFESEMAKMKKTVASKEIKSKTFDLPAFALVCLTGYGIGKIAVPVGDFGVFSLGATGGVLIVALTLGYLGKIGPFCFRMDSIVLGVVRQLSLAFFLSIVGLRNGYAVFEALGESGAVLAFSALIVGALPVMAGCLIGRYAFKINWIMLSGAICGGMTSTPGLGAAIDSTKSDNPAAGYGATYPFALMGMVLFTIFLNAA